MSKFLAILLSLAALGPQTRGVRAEIPRAAVSTALVLLNAPSRAWAFVAYSPTFSQFAVIMTGSSAYAVTRIWDGRGGASHCYDPAVL